MGWGSGSLGRVGFRGVWWVCGGGGEWSGVVCVGGEWGLAYSTGGGTVGVGGMWWVEYEMGGVVWVG